MDEWQRNNFHRATYFEVDSELFENYSYFEICEF